MFSNGDHPSSNYAKNKEWNSSWRGAWLWKFHNSLLEHEIFIYELENLLMKQRKLIEFEVGVNGMKKREKSN